MACVIAEPRIGVEDNSCVEVCPVDATFAEERLPSEWLGYAQINADHDKPRTAN
jgi:NAD-dependent dihydropyrimidine dehydrogenase PreA subunit